jgi:hypothetical protein
MDDGNHSLLASLQSVLCATSGKWTPAYAGALIRIRTGKLYFMLALAAFFLCNVLLQRRWRWPLWLVALGLPLLFVVRIVFGA